MTPSFSTVMMAVLTTNAFLILLTLCLVNEKLLVRAGYRLMALFVAFTTLRFVLPIELPFTITLKLPAIFSRIIAKCHSRLFLFGEQPISLWQLFKIIWLLGFIIGLIAHIISYIRSARHITLYGKDLTNTEPYKSLLDKICKSKRYSNNFRVIELPGLDVPVLFGIHHPRILVPEDFDLPTKQMQHILQHEATHHFRHDILLKILIKIITLAYWWDIFSWLLNRQADVIFEMCIDNTLTATDVEATKEYMQCLIDVCDRSSCKRILPSSLTIGILPSDYKDLKRRFQLMTHNQSKPKTPWNILLLGIAVSIYLLSYAVIFEGYTSPADDLPADLLLYEDVEIGTIMLPSADNSYFIDNGDGTYDYYMNNKRLETVDSLDYYPEGIPIYTKDNAPQ